MGSRQVLAVLLRAVGQALETWADRLEAAITQVTATLPDPRVRKDLFAKLWRVWLTIVTQITRSLPVRWRAFGAGLLPIVLVGLFLSLGLWGSTRIFGETDISRNPSPGALEDFTDNIQTLPEATPSPTLGSEEAKESRPDPNPSEDTATLDTPSDLTHSQNRDDRPQTEINTEPDQTLADPLGPPLPNWSTLSSPLEQKVKAKLVGKLSPSWRSLVERLQVNFNQQELTVYLSDEWQTLTPVDQQRLVKTIQQQARQLDFPHLRFLDKQDRLLARTAIVGEGIIFQTPP